VNEYAQLDNGVFINWFLDDDSEERHRVCRIFLQGKFDTAFPAFPPLPRRNICDMYGLGRVGIAPRLFARFVARLKIRSMRLGIGQRADGQVNEIAFIRAVPGLLSSFCSNAKFGQRLDSFVTKSGANLDHYILSDKLKVGHKLVFRSMLVMLS